MSRFASRILALLTLAIFSVAAFAQQTPPPTTPPAATATTAAAFDAKVRDEVLGGLTEVLTKRAFVPGVDFSKWPTFLEAHRADIDKTDSERAFATELNKILKEFGVSHIALRTPRSATMRQTGRTSGLGMSVKKLDSGLEVTTVLPLGPAGQAGIEVGDLIKEVEGKPASDPAAIRVDVGKSVAIKVLKKDGVTTRDFTLENKEFSNRRPETLTWIGDDAAVIKIWTFAAGYDRKNVEALMQQADAKAKYLVVDLRSNGGGLVANLNHFLSLLMPDSTPVGTFVSRTLVDDYAKSHTENLTDPVAIAAWAPRKFKTSRRDGTEPFTGKIAVLLNRGSASASEIAGAALKDCRDALLLGGKSMGAVLASTYGKLPDGWEIQYPVQDYVTVKGERLEGHPREPDEAIELSVSGSDELPAKAIEILKKKNTDHSNAVLKPTGHGA